MHRLFATLGTAFVLIASTVAFASPAAGALPAAGAPQAQASSCTTFLESPTFGLPQELTYGPLGRVWVTEVAGTTGAIEGLDPSGAAALRVTLPDSDPFLGGGIVTPTGITVGPDGALWFVGWGPGYDRVGRVDPLTTPPTQAFFDLPAGSQPAHLTVFGGTLWIAAPGADAVLEVTTAGVVTVHALAAGSAPADLAVHGGALFVTERGLGRIARLDAGGAVTAEYAVGGDPTDIRASGTGLWYTKRTASAIGYLDPLTGVAVERPTPTPASSPGGIALDGVGGLWVTESAANRIARVDLVTFPAPGSIDETVLTVSSPQPLSVATLPDGTVWFGQYAPFVAHFKPAADGSVLPLPPAVALTVSGPELVAGGTPVYATTTTFTIASSVAGLCADEIHYRVTPAGGAPGAEVVVGAASASFTLPNGTWTVEFFAVGPGGAGLATTSPPITVDDTAFPDRTPPVVHVPADITVAATGEHGAAVVFTATASDDVDPAPAVTCVPPSGSPFAPGVTTVTCTARDASGNVSAPASFTVTVTVPPPSLAVPPTIVVAATGVETEVAVPASASSVVDGTQFLVTCVEGATSASGWTPAPGVVLVQLAAGPHDLTCAVEDRHGNRTVAVTHVDVTTAAPALTLPGPITVDATSPAGAPVMYAASAASTGFGTLAVGCAPASGSTFPIGDTIVRCSSEDPLGQRTEASFVVHVVVPPPALVVPADITVSTFRASLPVSFTATASSAVYGPLAVTCDPASGSPFVTGTTTTVVCSTTDGHGRDVTRSFTVTVERLPCGDALVALSTRARSALRVDGGSQVRIVCGGVVVASSAAGALRLDGRSTLDATYTIVGEPYVDPFATLPAPDAGGLPVYGRVDAKKGSLVLAPGRYTGGISISDRATVTFLPGVYIVEGGLKITGGTVRGDGVFLYGRAVSPKAGCGGIDVRGGSVSLSAPTAGPYAGVLVMQDRVCTDPVRIAGGAALSSLDGVVYAPAAPVVVTGDGSLHLGIRVFADTIRIGGGATITLDFGG